MSCGPVRPATPDRRRLLLRQIRTAPFPRFHRVMARRRRVHERCYRGRIQAARTSGATDAVKAIAHRFHPFDGRMHPRRHQTRTTRKHEDAALARIASPYFFGSFVSDRLARLHRPARPRRVTPVALHALRDLLLSRAQQSRRGSRPREWYVHRESRPPALSRVTPIASPAKRNAIVRAGNRRAAASRPASGMRSARLRLPRARPLRWNAHRLWPRPRRA